MLVATLASYFTPQREPGTGVMVVGPMRGVPCRGASARDYQNNQPRCFSLPMADTGLPPARGPRVSFSKLCIEMKPCSGITARASELDQSREASRIGRALAACRLAAEPFGVPKVAPSFIADHGRAPIAFTPNAGSGLPITADEYVSRSGTRRRGHHYRSRSPKADAERNPRRSERQATRQKQTRQNFRFHFLVLLTHCMKARELPSLSGSISVGDE